MICVMELTLRRETRSSGKAIIKVESCCAGRKLAWVRVRLMERADGRRAFRRPVKVAREGCWRYRKCEC